jgi:hypothetical protein
MNAETMTDHLTNQQILDITARVAAREVERIASELKAMHEKLAKTQAGPDKFNAALPAFTAALAKEGLAVSEVHAGAAPRFSVTAVPTSGKFRFLKDSGYMANGSGKNERRLEAKAERLQEIISTATGFNCNVNQYSLEVKDDSDRKRVLIEVWATGGDQ